MNPPFTGIHENVTNDVKRWTLCDRKAQNVNVFSIGILYFLMMFSHKFRSGTECDNHSSECDKRGSECDKHGTECDKHGTECDKNWTWWKSATHVALLPWSHNLLLLSKGLDDDATLYYTTKTVEKVWNRDLLLNAIKLKMYETQALARVDNNFDRTLPIEQAQYTNELFGSSYNLGFLGVTSPIRSTQESPNCLIISS